LPNRAAALRATESALHRARRTGVVVAMIFIDIDGFMAVNDTHGHAAGDQILIAVADRLRQQVRGGDTAARLGGDEFVVLLDDCGSEHQAVAIAERLVAALAEPVALDDTTTARVGASVGVALSLDGGVDADALLRDADAAVYRVKDTGGHRVEVFSAAMRDEITVLRDVESALRRAIDRHELVLQYQPVVDLRRQAISGFEALVRWQRPDADALPPSAFLRIAEQSALVCELDRWVLYAAAQEASAWPGDVSLTVNISDRSLRRGDLVAVVREALTGTGLPAHRLQLDIRESALADAGRVAPQLDAVRSLGVRIAVDDFGIGHRELDDRVLPLVDVVKTHRSVLADSDGALLEYAVRTAAAHGVEVVVEGVERDEQLRAAAALHCTAAQGHLLGHPVSAAEAMRRLQPRRRPRPRPHARERGVERCLGRDPVVAPLPR
ncbi:MAG: putative bifunctional diguanylate cyclase/phosphodiesterase, partial [Jatrophihabitans sp.]|uniref:putative bifunctional diguanylate cyclase/phosphodiesterase n=1 Tax=Jatrophihabitans sp. TaxID=1932789 RepID=UPI003F7F2D14